MRYQGVVPLGGGSLAESLEAYFASSEQLPTRLILAADDERGAGFLVQKVPGAATADESELEETWNDAQRGIEKLSAADLLACPVEELLERGFAEHDLRLFRGAPVQFECRCNQGRVSGGVCHRYVRVLPSALSLRGGRRGYAVLRSRSLSRITLDPLTRSW
jgi:molecular chaperone Hsp33